ncbi:inositol monophosphatase [Thermaerobacter sp. FW80]|uniref:inositol monophosphatase family protein n=1 Tax=Thermaerobacter sp. FW80 TaxID=2546351 RepID=UPI000DB57909|nr:inositol monophosphatase family protein [Thermaerobacter sp. FW80]PZN06956.1 MAG: inositol monophosphatase [Bacillota bacterium]QBS37651.1 inositol monophosphatase [Thermaerobacter sp. FW80]
MDLDVEALRDAVIDVALRGGEMLRQRFGSASRVRTKSSRYDLVTEADEAIEAELTAYVRRQFPDHAVVGEEDVSRRVLSGQAASRQGAVAQAAEGREWEWLIDPIDGTTNFIHGLPIVATSVAVMYRDEVLAGAVFNPMQDELFVAVRRHGATLNGRPLRVSTEEVLAESLLATGFQYDAVEGRRLNVELFRVVLNEARNVRAIGSAALSLCYVGAGRLSGFWELRLGPWDLAAGALVVREAGGRLSRLDGGPFDIWQPSVVATNGRIHDQLVALLRQASAGA